MTRRDLIWIGISRSFVGMSPKNWLFVCSFADGGSLRQAQRPEVISIRIPKEAIDYLDIKNLDPETRIEVEASSDDCAMVRIN